MFTTHSLSDREIADASIQYRIESATGYVDFAILNGELCAHTWQCPKEGRQFLKALEEHAEKNGLRLVVPNVLNHSLEHILRTTEYVPTRAFDEYLKRECVVWSKEAIFSLKKPCHQHDYVYCSLRESCRRYQKKVSEATA